MPLAFFRPALPTPFPAARSARSVAHDCRPGMHRDPAGTTTMQNVLGTCLALAIIGGGFALTGDLARLADRGMQVIQATDVPDHDAPVPVAAGPVAAEGPRNAGAVQPARVTAHVLDAVDITTLTPGSRVVVWIRHPGRSTPADMRSLVCDVIDPAGREALVSEVEPAPASGAPAFAPAPPRRVLIAGSGPTGAIVRGGTLELRPQGIAGAGGNETLGPVFALDVQP